MSGLRNFSYRVRDRKGKTVTGVMQGESAQTVSESLGKQGYFPMSVMESKTFNFSFFDFLKPGVKKEDLNIFTRQLWTMQKAGLPLLSGLGSLREQASTQTFKKVIVQLIKDVEAGNSFSVALSQQPRVFEPVFVHMVRAGEASGKLDEIFFQLSEMGQFETATKSKIRSATIYPIITLFSLMTAFVIVVTFVVPKFIGVFGKADRVLPLPTRILLAVNGLIRYHWLESIMAAIAAVFLFRFIVSTPVGRFQWDRLKLKFPVIGKLVFFLQLSRFSRILAELLKTGVPILQSLQLVSDTLSNKVLERAVTTIQQSVNEGKGMSVAMKSTGIFTPMIVQMVEVGENSGRTDELLHYVSGYYEDQANTMIKNFSTLIEPILLFFLGGMVLLLALGVFLPVWDLVNVVK